MVEYYQSFTKKQFILFLINQDFKEIFSNLFFHACITIWLMWLTWEENRKIVITQAGSVHDNEQSQCHSLRRMLLPRL